MRVSISVCALLVVICASISHLHVHCANTVAFSTDNGHAYEFVDAGRPLNSDEANAFAKSRYLNGQQGYLVTIGSAAESAVLYDIFRAQEPRVGLFSTLWAGAVREGGSWYWYALTRKSGAFYDVPSQKCITYCNWYTEDYFPDNSTCLQIYSSNIGGPEPGKWKPAECSSLSEDVIVEYDAGTNCSPGYTYSSDKRWCVPTPTPTTTTTAPTPIPITTTVSPSTTDSPTVRPNATTTEIPPTTTTTTTDAPTFAPTTDAPVTTTTTTTSSPNTTTTRAPVTTTEAPITTTTTWLPNVTTTDAPVSTTDSPVTTTTTTWAPNTTTTWAPNTTTTWAPNTTTTEPPTFSPNTTTSTVSPPTSTLSPNTTTSTPAPNTTTTSPPTTTPSTTTTPSPNSTTTTHSPNSTTTTPPTTTTNSPNTTTTTTHAPNTTTTTTTTNSPNTTTTTTTWSPVTTTQAPTNATTTTWEPMTSTTHLPSTTTPSPAGYPYVVNATMVPTSGGLVTIMGWNFGNDKSVLLVWLGMKACWNVAILVEDTVIACTAEEGVGKDMHVIVTVAGVSNADNNTAFSREPPRVTGVQLLSESIIIAGANFGNMLPYAEVSADNITCAVVTITHNRMVCTYDPAQADWNLDDTKFVALSVNIFGQHTHYMISPAEFINTAPAAAAVSSLLVVACLLFISLLM